MMTVPDFVTDVIQQDTIYALTVSDRTLYAGRKSGLYRSQDAGITWVDALTSLPDVDSVTVTAIVAQGDAGFAGVKGAILCSYDAGENWAIVGLASPPPTVVALAVSPNYVVDSLVIAGTSDDGVFVSIDRGASWVAWNFGLIDTHIFALGFSPHYAADKLILAGTESGLFMSKNGGRGWSELDFPMDAAPVVSLGFAADDVIYAGTEANGLFVSDDKGKHWRRVENPLISGGVNTILIRDNTTQHISLLLEDKVVFSVDNGQSWKQSRVQIADDKTPMTMSVHPTETTKFVLGFADGDLMAGDVV